MWVLECWDAVEWASWNRPHVERQRVGSDTPGNFCAELTVSITGCGCIRREAVGLMIDTTVGGRSGYSDA